MSSKHKGPFESDHITSEFWVVQNRSFKNLYLYLCLCVELFLVFYYLQGHILFFLVVVGFEDSPKRTSTKKRNYFILI